MAASVGRESVFALTIRRGMCAFLCSIKNICFPSKGPVTLCIVRYTTIDYLLYFLLHLLFDGIITTIDAVSLGTWQGEER